MQYFVLRKSSEARWKARWCQSASRRRARFRVVRSDTFGCLRRASEIFCLSSVVFQSWLTFVQLGCFFSVSGCFHFFQCCQIGWLQEGGIQHPHLLANARRRARQRFHDYPNCLRLLLLLLLLLLLVPKQYEEVREGLSVSEGGSQR